MDITELKQVLKDTVEHGDNFIASGSKLAEIQGTDLEKQFELEIEKDEELKSLSNRLEEIMDSFYI